MCIRDSRNTGQIQVNVQSVLNILADGIGTQAIRFPPSNKGHHIQGNTVLKMGNDYS